ncbi:MAG: hypothetical protein ACLQI7_24765, partial [Streptosporangiaceae bacterium]
GGAPPLRRGRAAPGESYARATFRHPAAGGRLARNPADALGAPAGHVMEFLTARGLLTAGRATTWRAAAGGFARFADRIARTLTTVRTGLPVRAITCRCGRSSAGAGDQSWAGRSRGPRGRGPSAIA